MVHGIQNNCRSRIIIAVMVKMATKLFWLEYAAKDFNNKIAFRSNF